MGPADLGKLLASGGGRGTAPRGLSPGGTALATLADAEDERACLMPLITRFSWDDGFFFFDIPLCGGLSEPSGPSPSACEVSALGALIESDMDVVAEEGREWMRKGDVDYAVYVDCGEMEELAGDEMSGRGSMLVRLNVAYRDIMTANTMLMLV